jgi:hypothetical protein
LQIVGITDHSDVETRLEKRVVSRLNAQYVFMSKPRGAQVCEFLYNACTLPQADRSGVLVPDRSADGVSAAFGERFNAKIEGLFGKYEIIPGEEPGQSRQGVDENVGEIRQRRAFLPGAMCEAFDVHCDWGRDMR